MPYTLEITIPSVREPEWAGFDSDSDFGSVYMSEFSFSRARVPRVVLHHRPEASQMQEARTVATDVQADRPFYIRGLELAARALFSLRQLINRIWGPSAPRAITPPSLPFHNEAAAEIRFPARMPTDGSRPVVQILLNRNLVLDREMEGRCFYLPIPRGARIIGRR